MGASVNVGKLFGVRIQIHWTFLLIIAWAVYQGWVQGGDAVTVLLTVALVLAIFICVVLHELGHSLAARNFGIATRKITLLPIGGVASLERMPEDPKQELLVAAAGPAVNLVIAGFLFLFVHSRFRELGDAEAARQFFEKVSAANFLTYLFMTNVMLVAFNAIPAFPMDGGRVLRALLSFKMDRVRATQIAVKVGQLFAIFFFFMGFFYNPLLLFIGLFVYFGASGEFIMVQHLTALKGHKVNEAMMTNYTLLKPDDDMQTLADILLAGTERHFIVAQGDEVVGVLYHENIIAALTRKKTGVTAGDLMDRDFQRIDPDDELTEVYRMVQERRHNFFPVTENGKLLGTIDMENINEFMMIRAGLDY